MGALNWDEVVRVQGEKQKRSLAKLNSHWADEYFRLLAHLADVTAHRRVVSANRASSRRQLDERQTARLVRYAEAHARLSADFKGKALSREIVRALPDLYLGRLGLFRADRSAFNSQQIPRADEE